MNKEIDIQSGDIVLVRGNVPIISRIIRWFANSEYTHVGLAISKELILEIDFHKDLAIRANKHKNYDIFRLHPNLTDEEKLKMATFAISRAKKNVGYDWKRILSFAFEKIFRTRFTLNEVNRVICSEIVDEIYESIGIDLVPTRQKGNVTPEHLAQSPFLKKVFSHKAA